MEALIKQTLAAVAADLVPLKEKLDITANICTKAGQQPTGSALRELANLAATTHSLIAVLTSGDKELYLPEMTDIVLKVCRWMSLCEQFCITALVTETDHDMRFQFADILLGVVRLEQPVMRVLSNGC